MEQLKKQEDFNKTLEKRLSKLELNNKKTLKQ
mgnify:CR=1 FL=1